MAEAWPDIPYLPWRDTCSALHLWAQIVGKYRLANTPWLNHSWHATLTVDARGLTTGLVPDGPGIEVAFDFQRHALIGVATDGRSAEFPLGPMSVASFHAQFRDLLAMLGGNPDFHGRPNEVVAPTAFAEDRAERPYDAQAVARFFGACVSVDRVFKRFRTGFLGKVSPVHLFWGSFDLAVTRFSGRKAPLHPGGIPALPDAVTREAYSHEVSSAGFWPGGGGVDYPAFYSYAYPPPARFSQAIVAPAEAFFHETLGEFLLPYEAVRRAEDPDAMLMAFLGSTYRAATDAGNWDCAALECLPGMPGIPRSLTR
ncbi:hypothetical protein Sa4125_35180 [Aureimonas sp. SA4125]|uniref:DUF5996 family protein n=1 Tax=Aureimonas sp. SA4125 TaxID=2826993 RepID=UPI001CC3C3F0|nr:DUF5996 family protein [Aureimonas sp. SA4125]BDA85976.1 hypothetical protein Sa4125_35180 [Aureimonas sp. SA4125]